MNINDSNVLISKLAMLVYKEKGSDIIINSDANPALKIDGKVCYLRDIKLATEDVEEIITSLISDKQYDEFIATNELNFMVRYPGIANFRGNAYRQRGSIGVILRIVPLEIPSFESLSLPNYLRDIVSIRRGLVIVSGPTGVGKSTTLAAMIDYRNSTFNDHIITVEDPIEFLHGNKKSVVTQREVGVDTDSYYIALKNALRQAPDMLLIGEIRDAEVMKQALHFSETGHLVLATIHATSPINSLERIINFFNPTERYALLSTLANELKCVVGQRLMITKSGTGRIPAFEIMTVTSHIKQLISENKLVGIPESMSRLSIKEGVILFDDYIFNAYEKGIITYEEALKHVDSINNFRLKLRSESKQPLPEELKTDETGKWAVEDNVTKAKSFFGSMS